MADLFSKISNPLNKRNAGGWTVNAAGGSYIDDWVTIGVNGGIFQGTGTPASPTTGLKIYNSSGVGLVEMWKAGVKTFYFDTNGDVFLTGTITASAGSVGGWTIGSGLLTAGTGSDAVGLAPGSYPFYAGSATAASAPFRVSKAGALTATSATITGAITASSGSFTGALTIGTDGGIYQGTGTFASPTTGLKIWNDSGIGRIATYNGGTAAVYFDTTGALWGALGDLKLSEGGLTVSSHTSPDPTAATSLLFKSDWAGGHGEGTYRCGRLFGYVYQQSINTHTVLWLDSAYGSATAKTYSAIEIHGGTLTSYLRFYGDADSKYCTVDSTGAFASTAGLSGTTLTSTVATGTAPFTSTSTTVCTNVNADSVDGYHITDWTDWTPTVYQSTTSVSVTVTEAKYALVGKVCHIYAVLAITGDGVAANAIEVRGVPTAAVCAEPAGMIVGTGWVYDSSATTIYIGASQWNTAGANHFRVVASGNSSPVGATPNIQLANNDTVRICATYRIA